MKCLSLIQPFATLIVIGAKLYETREWRTQHRGPLAIHACKKFPEAARALCRQEPFRSVLVAAGYRLPADLPTGAILGTVDLEECLRAVAVLPLLHDNPHELAFGNFTEGRWAWRLAQPTRFGAPQRCRGRLGLFEADVQPLLF